MVDNKNQNFRREKILGCATLFFVSLSGCTPSQLPPNGLGAKSDPVVLAPAMAVRSQLTDAEWDQAHAEIRAVLSSEIDRQRGRPRTERAAAYAKAVRSVKWVYDSGLTSTSDVWIRLLDGTSVSVNLNERGPYDPSTGDPLSRPLAAAVPEGQTAPGFKKMSELARARLADFLGAVFGRPAQAQAGADGHLLPGSELALLYQVDNLAPNAARELSAMLTEKKYQVQGNSAPAIHNLRTQVKNVGFFWMSTHGFFRVENDGEGKGIERYAILSGELSSTSQCQGPDLICQANRADVKAGLIFVSFDEATKTGRIAFTGRFIKTYWSFAPGGVAIIDACTSAHESWANNELFEGLRTAGVSTLLGWTKVVGSGFAEQAVTFLVDRSLGANRYSPPTPKTRPFPIPEVLASMNKKGISTEASGGAQLVLKKLGAYDSILTPSVRNFAVKEFARKLEVYGVFGNQPGTFEMAGTPLNVDQWSDRKLIVSLPVSGPGSKGLGKAMVGPFESNSTPLTEWQGTFRGRHILDGLFGAPGPWMQMQCSRVRVRADVHRFRLEADGTPQAGESRDPYSDEIADMNLITNATPDSVCAHSWGGYGIKVQPDGSESRTDFAGFTESVSWDDDNTHAPSNWWFLLGSFKTQDQKIFPNFNSNGATRIRMTQTVLKPLPAPPPVTSNWSTASVGQVGYMMQQRGYSLGSDFRVSVSGDRFAIVIAPPQITPGMLPPGVSLPQIPGSLSVGDHGEVDLQLDPDATTLPQSDTPG